MQLKYIKYQEAGEIMGFKGQGAIDKLGSNPKPAVNPQTAFKELHSKANRDRVIIMPVNDKKSYIYWDLEKLTKLRIKHIDRKGRIDGILEIHSDSGYYSVPVHFSIRNLKTMEFYAPNLGPDRNQWAVLSLPQLNIRLQSNTVKMPKEFDKSKIRPMATQEGTDVFATLEDLEEMMEFMASIGYCRTTMLRDLPFMLDMLKASQERESQELAR